ncbi:MAG: hypothetical protein DWQ01_07790 [Planctomycetota bacterium]|nr:MAG: hypothetical protein DWQ01_07790 [Planctomycetota bacterium]
MHRTFNLSFHRHSVQSPADVGGSPNVFDANEAGFRVDFHFRYESLIGIGRRQAGAAAFKGAA